MKGQMASGALLMVVGAWVLTQVLAGHALQRLKLAGTLTDMQDPTYAPDQGYNNVPHDGQGRPL